MFIQRDSAIVKISSVYSIRASMSRQTRQPAVQIIDRSIHRNPFRSKQSSSIKGRVTSTEIMQMHACTHAIFAENLKALWFGKLENRRNKVALKNAITPQAQALPIFTIAPCSFLPAFRLDVVKFFVCFGFLLGVGSCCSVQSCVCVLLGQVLCRCVKSCGKVRPSRLVIDFLGVLSVRENRVELSRVESREI